MTLHQLYKPELDSRPPSDFHGHWCPGLAVGIRAAEWALDEMGKSGDEEIVSVVKQTCAAWTPSSS